MANSGLLDALGLTEDTKTVQDHVAFQTSSREETSKNASSTSPLSPIQQSNTHRDWPSKFYQNPLSVFLTQSVPPLSPKAPSPVAYSSVKPGISYQFAPSLTRPTVCNSVALEKAWRILLRKVKLRNAIHTNTDSSIPSGHLLQKYQSEVARVEQQKPELFVLRESKQDGSLQELEARTRRTRQLIQKLRSIAGDAKPRLARTGPIPGGTSTFVTTRGTKPNLPSKCSSIERRSRQRAHRQSKISARMRKVSVTCCVPRYAIERPN